jgi:acyl carrier protein
MSHIGTVREFVMENFLFGDGGQLQDDTSFMETGIIDSTGILELITFLEEKYEINIEDDELIPENLDNLQNVAGFIERKMDPSLASGA